MKAFVLPAFDADPEIRDLELPDPGEGEVRVRISAASVNGFDLAVIAGRLNGMMEHRFPVVIGKDFAGTVDAVGQGVTGYSIGDRVFGVVTKPHLGDGSFAEYATVPVAVGIAHTPDGLDDATAAALGLAGTAALDSVDAARLYAGGTVLVAGASGGVGNQAIQHAALAGAITIATAHTEAEREQVTGLGAAEVVDYTEPVAPQVTALQPKGVDAVLHFAGDPAELIGAVRDGGVFVSTIVSSPEQLVREGVAVIPIYANPDETALNRLAAHQASGDTVVTVQQVYGFEELPAALAHFQAGTLGKLVIRIAA